MPIYPSGYYVYSYLRSTKSQNGDIDTPYYIGKGKGNRAYKGRHIVAIPKDLNKIMVLAENMSEVDALQAEIFLINTYGRINNQTGILHNRTNGGEGSSGRYVSKELREHLSRLYTGQKQTVERVQKTVKARKKYMEKEENRIESGSHFSNETMAPARHVPTNTIIHVSKDDPRWKTGEIVGHQHGKTYFTDGIKNYLIFPTDERIKLLNLTKGIKFNKSETGKKWYTDGIKGYYLEYNDPRIPSLTRGKPIRL
jgi:hypothetical protein